MKTSEKLVIWVTVFLSVVFFGWAVFLIAEIKGAFGHPWEAAAFSWRVYTVGTATLFFLAALLLPFKRGTGKWFALPALAAAGTTHGYAIIASPSAPEVAGRALGLPGSLLGVVIAVTAFVFLFIVAPRYERRRV